MYWLSTRYNKPSGGIQTKKLILCRIYWSFVGVLVLIAYIPQIIANLQGAKAQPFNSLLFVAAFA